MNSDSGASNCGKHCIPNQSNSPFKARSLEISSGVILDFLSRRRCDGKVMIEISFTYSVKLISNPQCVYFSLE